VHIGQTARRIDAVCKLATNFAVHSPHRLNYTTNTHARTRTHAHTQTHAYTRADTHMDMRGGKPGNPLRGSDWKRGGRGSGDWAEERHRRGMGIVRAFLHI